MLIYTLVFRLVLLNVRNILKNVNLGNISQQTVDTYTKNIIKIKKYAIHKLWVIKTVNNTRSSTGNRMKKTLSKT